MRLTRSIAPVVAALMLVSCVSEPSPDATPPPEAGAGASSGEVVAVVLGEPIEQEDLEESAGGLTAAILRPLFERLSAEQGITASEAEIRAFFSAIGLPDSAATRELARSVITRWKTDRLLHERYGGTVIFQQGNPFEPVEAYAAFLRDQQARGAFTIRDAGLHESFWRYFTRDHGPWVVPPDRVDYSTPWWLRVDANE